MSWPCNLTILTSPHLMLTYISYKYSIITNHVWQFFKQFLRFDYSCFFCFYIVQFLPIFNFFKPLISILSLYLRKKFCQNIFDISYQIIVYIDIFPYLTGIYVYVDYLCFWSKFVCICNCPVWKSRSNCYYQISIVYGVICAYSTMHTCHSQKIFIIVKISYPHYGVTCRYWGFFYQISKFARSITWYYTTTWIYYRSFWLIYKTCYLIEQFIVFKTITFFCVCL